MGERQGPQKTGKMPFFQLFWGPYVAPFHFFSDSVMELGLSLQRRVVFTSYAWACKTRDPSFQWQQSDRSQLPTTYAIYIVQLELKLNTIIGLNHHPPPPPTTTNFLTSSRHSRRLKLGIQLNPNLKKKKNLSKNLSKKLKSPTTPSEPY